MSTHILFEEEIQANYKRREDARDYIQLFLKTDNYETHDAEVKSHLDLQDHPDAMEYDWVDIKIAGA